MARLSDIARVTAGRLVGDDAEFCGAVIDSRRCEPGQLFVALPGSRVDGHDYLQAAADAGAAGALVARQQDCDLPQVVVEDVLESLQHYAAEHRQQFKGPVVAVTGSNGKTTTKEILAAVLGSALGAEVLYTRGNLNNHIGVPLTLLGMREGQGAAVIEMGANHPGEIAMLTAIARPDVGIVTLAGAAHLEGFGSIEGVARSKGELFAGLPANGMAIINADDDYADLWRELAGERRHLTFGLSAGADVTADSIRRENGHQHFLLRTPVGAAEVRLPLSGQHNVMNALAAAAAALALGVQADSIAGGLATANAVGGRLQIVAGPGGSRIVDDSYNANPTSMQAALNWLAEQPGRRWMAMGDMGELGADATAWHASVGAWARKAGVQLLLAVGELSAETVDAFGRGAVLCSGHDEAVSRLLQALDEEPASDVTLLVKGSRSMQMERVVQALVKRSQGLPTGQVVNGG